MHDAILISKPQSYVFSKEVVVKKILEEERLTFNRLAHQENVAPSTCWRWAIKGVRGKKLESFNVGGRRYTTREAFQRFVQELNDTQIVTNPRREVSEQNIERVNRELKKFGI